jgi:hypothetical protein
MKKALILLVCLSMGWGCAGSRVAGMSGKQRSERLATERGTLQDLTDPVERTKSYITISEILLSFAADAIREGATADLKPLMEQYIMAIEEARDAMVDSKRDAERRPAGYKELEIAVRGQLRVLQDLSTQLTLEERKPIDAALAAATAVHREMLQFLFPQSKSASARPAGNLTRTNTGRLFIGS